MSYINDLIKTGSFRHKIEGKSMLPLLKDSDTLYFKSTKFSLLNVNDIVLVDKHKKSFVHRVIYKSRKYLITKGDNNLQSDGKIIPKNIIGLVYKVKRKDQKFVPDDVYLLQSTQYFSEIRKINRIFKKRKIRFLFLKGLVLHLYYEKSYPKRVFGDCDVLIDKIQEAQVYRIFCDIGYKTIDNSFSGLFDFLKDKKTEIMFCKQMGSHLLIFDVHLEPVFLMNQLGKLEALYSHKMVEQISSRFLNEKKMVNIEGEFFPILSPSNLILYLSLHFFRHNYKGGYMINFLYKVLKKEIRIKRIFKDVSFKIREYKLQNFIYPVFKLIEKYYGLSFPVDFTKSVKPQDKKLKYIKSKIISSDIFSNESRFSAGINRFRKLYSLSPNHFIHKITIFFNPQVIFALIWVSSIFIWKLLNNSMLIKKFQTTYQKKNF